MARHIEEIYKHNPLVQTQRRMPNLLRQAKKVLPCGKRNLSHLITPDGKRVDEPEPMARLLKRQWEPVWNKPNPPTPTVEEFISSYEKKIEGDVPAVTVEHFHRVMERPRDSSTGPDGIPFSVYRHLHETAAPLLFKYYEYMLSLIHI